MVDASFPQDEATHGLMTDGGAMRPGRKQHAREQVAAVQRGRLIAATVDTVAEVGYAGLTVAQVIDRAGISRRTFYEVFKDTDDCFMATYEAGLEQLTELVLESYVEESSWREGIRAGLATLLGFLDVEPGWARLLVIEALCAGEVVLGRRVQTIRKLSAAIHAGYEQGTAQPLASDIAVGGSIWAIYSHLLDHPERSLLDLQGPLMAAIILPYLGRREASRELEDQHG